MTWSRPQSFHEPLDRPSIQDHLPYFAGKNAQVQEVNISCCPEREKKSCKYVINTKWIDDDDRAANRWEEIKAATTVSTGTSNVDELSSHSGTSYVESTWGDMTSMLDESMPEYPDAAGESSVELSRASAGRSSEELVPTVDRGSSNGDEQASEDLLISTDADHASMTSSLTEGMTAPWQDIVEMLAIRIIILEKAQKGIVRRQIDFETPSDKNISSIYRVLENELYVISFFYINAL
ncbi:hypothetical protein OESDEN_13702 [Oesophagostomum dentatum]|uniref:Uncharacterized protein n=1 Tax=Oesophagostomum dentatum TaxID=61180 RepID=A0A0B1SRM0_OESDE|nr:hypothetical protein OESDEN_13702 [Oesophagostomum dentatum]